MRARDAMDRKYSKPLDIPALARVAQVSEAPLIRTVRETLQPSLGWPHAQFNKHLPRVGPRPARGPRYLRRFARSRGQAGHPARLHALADRRCSWRSEPRDTAGASGSSVAG